MKIHIPILLLNLERSQERRLYMEKQLNKLGLEFEIFKAVDGRNLTSSDLKQYSKKEALREVGRELSPGEIGCALSQ